MFDLFSSGRGIARGVSPEQCWAVVCDHAGWKDWASMIAESTLVAPGENDPNGLGARRVLRDTQGGEYAEVINIFSPPNLFGYHICEAAPLKDHQGVISFAPAEGGTQVLWFMSANDNGYLQDRAHLPAMRQAMQEVMDAAVTGLIRACEAKAQP